MRFPVIFTKLGRKHWLIIQRYFLYLENCVCSCFPTIKLTVLLLCDITLLHINSISCGQWLRTHFHIKKNYEKMRRFLHFDLILKICRILKSWLLFRNKIHVYNLVLYKHTYSRKYMCIFIRLKQLLNFMANIGRNCTLFSMFVYFSSHQSLSFFPRYLFLKWPEIYISI